jgi:hypothetical protein
VHISNVLFYLRKKVVRGALTNGHEWIFILIKLNDNYDGATYKQSSMLKLPTLGSLTSQLEVTREPDLIAGILAYWVSLILICKIESLIDWILDSKWL